MSNSYQSRKTEVSIIVTAYNRNEFLQSAIESVKTQNIQDVKFETLLVTNFTPPDSILKDETIKCFASNEVFIGKMLAEAISNCSGEVICFLDDDDIFMENKLIEVKHSFEGNPDLVYYHNRYKEFGEFYNKPHEKINNPDRNERIEFYSILDRKTLNKILSLNGDHNNSSICIKRDVLLNNLYKLNNIRSCLDSFLFAVASDTYGKKILDNIITTLKRVHNSESNPLTNDWAHRKRLLKELHLKYSDDYLLISKSTSNSYISDYFRCRSIVELLEYYLLERKILSRKFFSNLPSFISCIKYASIKRVLFRFKQIKDSH